MRSLTDSEVRELRLRAQRLYARGAEAPTDAAQVASEICGLQAQVPEAVPFAVWARSRGATAASVEHARLQDRSVVRTWCMRGTLQLLATEDLHWLLPLLGPVFIRTSQRRRGQLGLDADTCERAMRTLRRALGGRGAMSRAEIAERLAAAGVHLQGQAVYHLIRHAALSGEVCCGPEREGETTFVLLRDWIDEERAVPRSTGLRELARRYLAAYGPAAPADLASWSGLALQEARAAWALVADQLLEVRVQGEPAWMLRAHAGHLHESAAENPELRLLPEFDPYLLGYASRELAVAPGHTRRIHPGGGLVRAAVLVQGQAVGTWRRRRRPDGLHVEIELFEALTPDQQDGLTAELADLARFLEVQVTWV